MYVICIIYIYIYNYNIYNIINQNPIETNQNPIKTKSTPNQNQSVWVGDVGDLMPWQGRGPQKHRGSKTQLRAARLARHPIGSLVNFIAFDWISLNVNGQCQWNLQRRQLTSAPKYDLVISVGMDRPLLRGMALELWVERMRSGIDNQMMKKRQALKKHPPWGSNPRPQG